MFNLFAMIRQLKMRWTRPAAEQGVATVRCLLGLSYATGRGVPQDDAEAVRWYRLAAEQGEEYNLDP